MQPIDLIPTNLSTICSLVAQEERKLIIGGMTRSFAHVKAHETVATLIRPPNTGEELKRWIGREASALSRCKAKGIGNTPPKVPNGSQWVTVDPETVWGGNSGHSILYALIRDLANMTDGETRAFAFSSLHDARTYQTVASDASKRLHWRQGTHRGYRSRAITNDDGTATFYIQRVFQHPA